MDKWILQFVIKVWWMRKHQKAWFNNHSQYDLIQAKRNEEEIDRELLKRVVVEKGEPKVLSVPEEQPAEPKQSDMLAESEDLFCPEHQCAKNLVDYPDGSRYECPECQRERGDALGLR